MTAPPVTAAYVVLSHASADRLAHLVGAIRRSSPHSFVLVAHDARATPAPRFDDERVQVWTHGLATDWGSWELVEATLGGFRRAREAVDPDLVVLVSGQCHPAVDLAAWERELVAAGGWQGQVRPVTYRPRWGGADGTGDQTMTRYAYRWWRAPLLDATLRRKGRLARLVWAVAHRTEPLVSVRLVERGPGAHVGVRRVRNPFTTGTPCQLGSQWVALDRTGLDQVLTELAPGAPLERVYRHTIIPDESALQTVLARHRAPVSARTVSHRLPEDRVLSWQEQLHDIEASGSPFGRKVEDFADPAVLERLDQLSGAA
ncbi:hypothetical protein [Humibacillus xanthopallidus]|uniref:Core-2/I-Branching enzyme n=1 Tax=Humibacillus xanthopallidus TaxID=412689 RepID=A0A543I0G7_9MICO|nr:hypothetical protein [Humibacillus xanthopallidus]TQM64000.1 hypothetical protein FBY41_0358 [Humibacillus xanthopallidus]